MRVGHWFLSFTTRRRRVAWFTGLPGFLPGNLVLPRLNRLHEAFKRSQVSPPASSSSQDQPIRPRPIPSQRSLTQQLTKEWPQYKALRQRYAGTRFEEQRQLHLPQKHKATVPESSLRVEMNAVEEQADNSKARDLLLEAPFMARGHPALECQRCLRPKPMGHFCLHDARFGGPHTLLSPPPP